MTEDKPNPFLLFHSLLFLQTLILFQASMASQPPRQHHQPKAKPHPQPQVQAQVQTQTQPQAQAQAQTQTRPPPQQQQQQQPQAQPQQLRKPVFITVEELQPGTSGHNLVVKVVSSKLVVQRSRPNPATARHVRIAECLVGDHTASIVFTARNEQGLQILLFFLCLSVCLPACLSDSFSPLMSSISRASFCLLSFVFH